MAHAIYSTLTDETHARLMTAEPTAMTDSDIGLAMFVFKDHRYLLYCTAQHPAIIKEYTDRLAALDTEASRRWVVKSARSTVIRARLKFLRRSWMATKNVWRKQRTLTEIQTLNGELAGLNRSYDPRFN